MVSVSTTPGSGWRSAFQALGYRGREGQWSYLIHRTAGLGVLLFLFLHIFDIFLIGFGEEEFNSLLFLYKAPPFRVLEVFLVFGLLFHAINGLRIILIDFVPGAVRYQRQMVWTEAGVILAVMLPASFFLLRPLFGG